MNNKFYVYGHYKADSNEIFYIGKGCNKRAWSKCARNKWWHNTVQKHGLRVEILHNNLEELFAHDLEANYIQCYGRICNKTGCLINLTGGYDGLFDVSELTKMKLRKRNFGCNNPMYGSIAWNRGLSHSKETKLKISIAKTGKKYKPLTEIHKNKIKKSHIGLKPSKATRLKLSNAQIGNKKCLGRKLSEETKEKIRKANLGKKASLETCKKMSKSQIKRYNKQEDL